jgi:putative solute:sodium symporter small subunit
VAIFGFQILLKVLGKPVPEDDYYHFKSGWERISDGNAGTEDLQKASHSALSVLGKISIDPADRDVLDHFISWTAYRLAGEEQTDILRNKVREFEEIAVAVSDIRDETYLLKKRELISLLSDIYGLSTQDIRVRIAPFEIKSAYMDSFPEDLHSRLTGAMGFYMTHNRSVLTDFNFLGFPFHYFYTAVFLLILFVGLCWIYCVRIDMFHRRYGIED